MWTGLSPYLPGQEWSGGVTAADTRGFVEAVLWRGRTGAPGRDLPPHPGQWHRVCVRFARWRDAGVWEQGTPWLIANQRAVPHARQRRVQRDSTVIRVHQQGTGAGKNGEQAVGRSPGGNTCKGHWSADGEGNVLGWVLPPGPAGDCPQAAGVLAPRLAPAQEVVAEAAHDRAALREQIAQAGANAVIPSNPSRKEPRHMDPIADAERHHLEQTFSKLKPPRRVATR